MKILAVIPARFASTRFPGKPLFKLKGKSMIQWVYEGVQKSDKFYKIVVATDHEAIFNEVKSFGGEVIMTSENHLSGTDRCGEVLTHFPDSDILINIQGDEPLVDFRQLSQLLEAFENPTTEIATLGIVSNDKDEFINPNRIKIVCDEQNNALYFSRSPIPNKGNYNGKENNFSFLRHIGLYAFRAETLRKLIKLKPAEIELQESLEQLRWMFYGYKIKVIETKIETPNIDSPEDVAEVLKHI